MKFVFKSGFGIVELKPKSRFAKCLLYKTILGQVEVVGKVGVKHKKSVSVLYCFNGLEIVPFLLLNW